MDDIQKGLFSSFGLPAVGEKEILQRKMRNQFVEYMANAGPVSRTKVSAHGDIGRAIGARFGAFLSNQQLAPEEQKAVEVATRAREAITELQGSPEFEKLNAEEKSLKMQGVMAREAFAAGDFERGTAMLSNLAQRKRLKQVQDEEFAQLETRGQRERVGLAQDYKDLYQMPLVGSDADPHDYYNVETGEPLGMGYVDPSNPMQVMIGDERFPLNEVTDQRPYKGEGRPFPSSVVTKLMDLEDSVLQMTQGYDTLLDIMNDGSVVNPETGQREINWLGQAGDVEVGLARVVDGVRSFVRWAGGAVVPEMRGGVMNGEKFDPNNARHVEKYLAGTEAGKFLDEEATRREIDNRERWKSQIVKLAYAVARAREPGGQRLSDADFQNAIQTIGGASTSPEAIRQLILDNLKEIGGRWAHRAYSMSTPDGGDNYTRYISSGRDTVFGSMMNLTQRMGMDAGTAANFYNFPDVELLPENARGGEIDALWSEIDAAREGDGRIYDEEEVTDEEALLKKYGG